MDPSLLDQLVDTPITLTLNARQFRLLHQWLEVEMHGRTAELAPLAPEGQSHAEAAQHLRELDEVLIAIRDAYHQAAAKLNVAIDR